LDTCRKELSKCQSELITVRNELERKVVLENELRAELVLKNNIETQLDNKVNVETLLRNELKDKSSIENELRKDIKERMNIESELRNQLAKNCKREDELRNELEIKSIMINEMRSEFEAKLSVSNKNIQELREQLTAKEIEQSKARQTADVEKAAVEKRLTETAAELSACQNRIKELTATYLADVQLKQKENHTVREEYLRINDLKEGLARRCQELESLNQEMSDRMSTLEQALALSQSEVRRWKTGAQTDLKCTNEAGFIEAGSLDDLTSLVQRELEVSSELDQSLLNQLVSRDRDLVERINNSSSSSLGRSEVLRLLQKVQEEGAAVLSLSERLFLAQHSGEAVPADLGEMTVRDGGARKAEILHFRLEQEKVVTDDLRSALDAEKRHSLELLASISRERQKRNDLEEELSLLRRQLKQKSRSSVSDSDNEEFLNTIEAQKRQIESLEESLQREKENFEQLQQVLQVERMRWRQDSPDSQAHSGSSGEAPPPGNVAALIISHLRRELSEERRRVSDLLIDLDREKRQQQQHLQQQQVSGRRADFGSGRLEEPGAVHQVGKDSQGSDRWRMREYELERLVAELELKVDLAEREEGRLRDTVQRLDAELNEERERTASGKKKLSYGFVKQSLRVNAYLN
jgi:hypothetical protein